MRMVDIISKKKYGGVLTKEEIDFFVKGYTKGEIPDYQISALLMAIYFNKMNSEETLNLTLAMENSGDRLDLSGIKGIKVDKHSTGGVGDKTTLVLGPMVASLGVKLAKMSGRGLGHTGGTIDKLESFPGFTTSLSEEQFIKNVNDIGMAVTGQTGNLAPADKKLYALRDVTATVDNISLIASSIMSKKLASGADAIVLDVKCGSGAFMKSEEDAVKLATEMVNIGKGAGRKTSAIISGMDEPLGYAVGNGLEAVEAINTLKGRGPKDLLELCVTLGSYMIVAAGVSDNIENADKMLRKTIEDGSAFEKFVEFIEAQGGNRNDCINPDNLIKVEKIIPVLSDTDGYISYIKSDDIGMASMMLGGGRKTKEDVIDLNVGIVLNKKVGDKVCKGDVLASVYANSCKDIDNVKAKLLEAYTFSENEPEIKPLIKRVIS